MTTEQVGRDVDGVYAIVNRVNGHVYVGSSRDIFDRFHKHASDLRFGRHHCIALQRAWNKHGADNFRLVMLHPLWSRSSQERLLRAEQQWIDGAVRLGI